MGFSVTWFAIPAANAASFFEELGLLKTGETEEFPESLVATAAMNTGWQVLWYNKYRCPFLGEDEIRAFSHSYEVLVCTVEEHCMDCSSALWRDGVRRWYLHHDGSRGPVGLDAEGALPEIFTSIREEMEAMQAKSGGVKAGVDFLFEIPLKVAQALTGFKHDEECPAVLGGEFHVMACTKPLPAVSEPKRGFFARLFAR